MNGSVRRLLFAVSFALVALPSVASARVDLARRPAARPVTSWLAAAAKGPEPLLYASGIDAVNIYAPFGNDALPVGQLGADSGVNTPNGLATDAQGNVWLAQPGASNGATNVVLEFARGQIKPSFVIHQPNDVEPTGVAVGSDGTVYVADFEFSGIYYVTEFAKGGTKPILTLGPFYVIGGIAVDGQNNLYVANTDATGPSGRILKFLPHQKTGVDLGISLPNYPGGIQINSSGDILVIDIFGRTIRTFAPGQTQSSHTIEVPALDPFVLALGTDDRYVFVSAGGGFCCGQSDIFEINYASGHVAKNITAGFPPSYPASGLTVTPRAPY